MRTWVEAISPAQAHDQFGLYQGEDRWLPEMDRQWESDDGFSVSSRLLSTEWGKVEHVSIQKRGKMTHNGEKDIPWKIKQEIKDELFGKKRLAIEVFPTADRMIDQCDVYHLWVFEKGFRLPFGIHPKEKSLSNTIHRGWSFNPENAEKLKEILGDKDE